VPRISRVKLLKQIKVDSAWALAPALFDSKGRIRRDHVMIEGRDEAHPEGSYFLEFWDQGKRKREAVGPDAFVAAEHAKHPQAELSAIRSGLI
jgi:integrase/recombinase XerD